MFKILSAAALCGSFAFGGSALAAVDPHQNLSSFTLENIAAAAAALGYQSEVLQNNQGQRALGITVPDGVKLLAQPGACQQGQCYGVQLFALFTGKVSSDVLSAFNAKHVFTSAFGNDQATIVCRYEISDYGIALGNVVSNLANLDSVVKTFVQFVQSSGTGASLTPPATTLPSLSAFAGGPLTMANGEPLYKLTVDQQKFVNKLGN